jgi:hypothetical protein
MRCPTVGPNPRCRRLSTLIALAGVALLHALFALTGEA